jgi:hypothetical protein
VELLPQAALWQILGRLWEQPKAVPDHTPHQLRLTEAGVVVAVAFGVRAGTWGDFHTPWEKACVKDSFVGRVGAARVVAADVALESRRSMDRRYRSRSCTFAKAIVRET